jgi:hypothetical protein
VAGDEREKLLIRHSLVSGIAFAPLMANASSYSFRPSFEKEQPMKKYPLFALPLGVATLACTFLISVLSGVVILMHALIPTAQMPFFYFEYLNLPVLSIALPIIGMLALAPIALWMAFARETATETRRETTFHPGRELAERRPEDRYLTAA